MTSLLLYLAGLVLAFLTSLGAGAVMLLVVEEYFHISTAFLHWAARGLPEKEREEYVDEVLGAMDDAKKMTAILHGLGAAFGVFRIRHSIGIQRAQYKAAVQHQERPLPSIEIKIDDVEMLQQLAEQSRTLTPEALASAGFDIDQTGDSLFPVRVATYRYRDPEGISKWREVRGWLADNDRSGPIDRR